MNLGELRQELYHLTAVFFCGADVLWADQAATKPKPPYVTLKTSGIEKPVHAIKDDETDSSYYPCSTILEVNLYTMGRLITIAQNVQGSYENTAQDDLMDFVRFIESEEITDICSEKNITVQLMSPIRDLSQLMNESSYRYRSMAEFTVSYVEEVKGRYGISSMSQLPNTSGGGMPEQAAEIYTIEEVEIKEE